MRVIRGRKPTPTEDRDATRDLLADVGETGSPVVRAWTPHRQIAFGRRDANSDGYERARRLAERRGFASVERSVGGRAVAYTGTTVAFAAIEPAEDARTGLQERYDGAVDRVVTALDDLGIDALPGEPDDSFCPGDHSIQADCGGRMGKIAGIAQRVTADAAMVSGCLTVADEDEIRDVLDPVYDALDVPFDPRSVGSVAAAGGPSEPDPVTRALERAFVGGRDREIESLDG